MKKAHFSIDDVGRSFAYISKSKPASIFDLRLYSQLLQWYKEYGVISNLYCIFNLDNFIISDTPMMYKTEFEENANWLKYGFHSGYEKPFIEDSDYMASYVKTHNFIEEMSMGQTRDIRLHSWRATDDQEAFLNYMGIKTLFMPNDKENPYDENGTYIRNGIIHRRTDVWFEKIDEINEENLGVEKEYLTLFTHEWCFDEQKERIDTAIGILINNGFVFV